MTNPLNKDRWPVNVGSAKDLQVSSVDELIGRLPAGVRISIDVGDLSSDGRRTIIKVGIPAADGVWHYLGEASGIFSPENARGDHIFENALHDAFMNLKKDIVSKKL